MNSDPTSKIQDFLKHILATLDSTFIQNPSLFNNDINVFKARILPQLKAQAAIVLNGTPYGSRTQFQDIWFSVPTTQHSLLSYDAHLIPGSGSYLIQASLKIRFDETGVSKSGESCSLLPDVPVPRLPSASTRSQWSPWFGLSLTMVVDETINTSFDIECISSFNWRITYIPEKSVYEF
ncbi:mRNA transport regulator [Komagataella phaffii CBS 7435]|uniref:mRNA transport regulator, essential nuclear protein n=2 Tax=Komagataella phaffii TaxID=460519 RepID=C4R858_KOMPG|nr:mRNA transport regulator, essential nuclear protein [Komagataella phaffii GS115]AOA64920.1 GQ67_04894T0 [Komagataella phaffii]CAH2450823.1 mRNA transport regulator [Komagataella phaffii CBS 7435]AOA69683.1 GQ68_04866T0 [Komagataella phaffii GS115]CAY71783.1 mRNA transport regulator, essential nuclear protein [Komagataella phaffii GS115]CCA40616.1 mRNA transport regulator [Komagataella phaffii CBS 7435]